METYDGSEDDANSSGLDVMFSNYALYEDTASIMSDSRVPGKAAGFMEQTD